MSRSLSYLCRGVFGAAFAGSLGFGATQAFAFAKPAQAGGYCDATGYDYASYYCKIQQGCDYGGYCTADGRCGCGDLP